MEKNNYLTQLPLENSDFTTDIDEQFFPYEGQQLLVLIKFPGGAIDAFKGIGTTLMDGDVKNVIDKYVGLFLHCKVGSFQIRKSFFSSLFFFTGFADLDLFMALLNLL